jgi:uncharacterized protein DUF3606
MNNHETKRSVIHPEDQNDLAYWTRKWGVNTRQINDAILETGSIRLEDIKQVLRRKGSLGSISLWLHRFFKGSLTLH